MNVLKRLIFVFAMFAMSGCVPMAILVFWEKDAPVLTKQELIIDADILIINKNQKYNIIDKHNWNRITKVKKEILTYAGKKKGSELKFSYNTGFGDSVEVTDVLITNKDGKTHKLSENEINIMDKSWVASAPRYPSTKIMVVSLPGVEVGSIVEYTVTEKFKNHPYFYLVYNNIEYNPILNQRLTISFPKNFKYDISDFDYIEKKNDIIFETKNQKAIKEEPNSANPLFYTKNCVITSDINENYLTELNQLLIAKSANQIKTAALANRITSKLKGNNKIRAIRDWIAKNISEAGPSFRELPESAISASDTTLKDKYGNSLDLAIIYYSMLKSIGYSPEFILTSGYHYKFENVLKQFKKSKAIFYQPLVKVNDFYLNDTDQYALLNHTSSNNETAYNLNTGKRIKIEKEENEVSGADYAINISKTGSAVINYARSYANNDYAFANKYFSELTDEKKKRYFMEEISKLSLSAKPLIDLQTDFNDKKGIKKYAVSIPKFAVKDGKYLYFELPNLDIARYYPASLDKRTTPYMIDRETKFLFTYKIQLPENIKEILLQPTPFSSEGIKVSSTLTDNILDIEISIAIKPKIIYPNNYQRILDINKILSHKKLKTIMIELN